MTSRGCVLYAGRDGVVETDAIAAEWDVRALETKEAALSALDGVDCIVSEQELPDGTGVELCTAVTDRVPWLPFVLVPATGSDELARAAVDAGVTAYCPVDTLEDRAALAAVVADTIGDGVEERELYGEMLDAVPDMVYALDEEGRFLATNEAGRTLTGRDECELVGRHISTVMDDEDVETGQEHIIELLKDPERNRTIFEMDLQPTESDPIPTENHVALLTDEDGAFHGSVGVIRDVRDRKRREQRLTVLNRALRHDIRNSMHVVLANAELVEREVDDPALRDRLATIRGRAGTIERLGQKAREIEQSLGGIGPSPDTVDLGPALSRMVATFRERYPEATIEADLPGTLWVEATDLGDVAVGNLVENSLEHAGDEPTVSIEVTRSDDTVTVTVADDGPGIPEKERAVLAQERETPLDHASGLGLWLVTWIVADSGGTISFESNDRWGSIVRLTLTRADPPPATDDATSGQETGSDAGSD